MLRKSVILLALLLLPGIYGSSVRIYKNAGCGHCEMYLDGLMSMLQKDGYTNVTIKDFMSDTEARKEVDGIQELFGVPLSMQGHLLVLIDDKYLFEGHVPTGLIDGYLKAPDGPIVVTQDKMDGATTYMMLMDGKPHTCPIDQTPQQCAAARGGQGADSVASFLPAVLPFALIAVAGGAIILALKGR